MTTRKTSSRAEQAQAAEAGSILQLEAQRNSTWKMTCYHAITAALSTASTDIVYNRNLSNPV